MATAREVLWQPAGAAPLGARWQALSVAGWMQACAAGRVLSTDRDSAAVRVEGEAGPWLVKWRAPRAGKGWKQAWRASRERREALGLLAARACGIPVPLPCLVLERRAALGRLTGSVLVRPFVEGLVAADVLLARAGGPGWGRLGASVRGWHDAGWRHGDCWPKNVLLDEGGLQALPVGASRWARLAPGPRLDRLRLRDLARLLAHAQRHAPPGASAALLAGYAGAAGLPAPEVIEQRLAPMVASVLARREADERTRPAREPHGPPQPMALPADTAPVQRTARVLGLA